MGDHDNDECLEFSPGQIVIESEPFVAILVGEAVGTHCHGCFKPLELCLPKDIPSIVCSGCRSSRYCSPQCVDKDSLQHSRECKININNNNHDYDNENLLRMMIRLIIKLKNTDGQQGEEIPGLYGKRRTFWDLMSHSCEYSTSARHWKEILSLHDVLTDILGDKLVGSVEDICQIYGRLMINSFEVCGDQRHVAKAWGLYLAPSLMDHSCVPNASVSFNGSNIVVRALKHLGGRKRRFDFARDVQISYIDLMEHTAVRQAELLRRYFFVCQCPRCEGNTGDNESISCNNNCDKDIFALTYSRLLNGQEPKEEEEELLYSIRCQNCTGRPVFLGPPNFILQDKPVCAKCETEVGSSTVDKYHKVYETVDALLDPDEDDDSQSVAQQDVLHCLELMSGLFHPCHRLMVRASEFAFEDAAVTRGDLKVAAEYGRACVQAYRRYGGHCWRNVGLYEYKLGSVLATLSSNKNDDDDSSDKNEALEHLDCAINILRRTHGSDHSLVKRTMVIRDKLNQSEIT